MFLFSSQIIVVVITIINMDSDPRSVSSSSASSVTQQPVNAVDNPFPAAANPSLNLSLLANAADSLNLAPPSQQPAPSAAVPKREPTAEVMSHLTALLAQFGLVAMPAGSASSLFVAPVANAPSSSNAAPNASLPTPLASLGVGLPSTLTAPGQRMPSLELASSSSAVAAFPRPAAPAWDPADRDTALKAASRPRFTESSGMKIRPFLDDAELFLELCGRPRDRWGIFVLQWLGIDEGDKVRRSHLAEKVHDYAAFKEGLITLFGRFEFEDSYRAALRSLRQSGSESVSAFAARTSDLCSRAYPDFATEAQLNLAVEHFVSGLADASSRDYLRRERARRRISWQEAVQMAQAAEVPRQSEHAAAIVAQSSTSCGVANPSPYSPLVCEVSGVDSSSLSSSSVCAPAGNPFGNRPGFVPAQLVRPVQSSRAPPMPLQYASRGAQPGLRPHFPGIALRQVTPTPNPHTRTAVFPRAPAPSSRSTAACFNCGQTDHLIAACPFGRNAARKCFTCGGVGHVARQCPTGAISNSSSSSSSSGFSTVSALSSAGKGAPQFFADVLIDGALVRHSLIDTGATFSMLPLATWKSLARQPPIQNFNDSPPSIVGVGGARANVRGYVDVPLEVAGVEVRHPLIVVESLAFPLLVGMDILRAHAATFSLGVPDSVHFQSRYCDVCLEPRDPEHPSFASSLAVACTTEAVTIKPMSASLVAVRLPSRLLSAVEFAVEPLPSLLLNSSCVAVPSVCAVSGATCLLAVANPTRSVVQLGKDTPVASVHAVQLDVQTPHASCPVSSCLPPDAKLQKVLRELHFDKIPDSAPHKSALRALVAEYLDVFAESDADVGTTKLVFHEIDTGDVRPLRQPVRRLPYGEMRTAVAKEVSKLVDAGIARPSTSPWASPVVMVKKKDGSWRMCVDYRRLNSATKFDSFPLPRLDEALDAFAGATVFSSLDLAMAYHQVPVKPSDVEKTAFVTHLGLFEMLKMPFGLCNAPSTYQRLMSIVLQGLIGRICLAYLDDVIVFSKLVKDHVSDLREVFERIRSACLKLKPSKCALFRDEVLYLGHTINALGVSPDPAKLRVLASWPVPETVRDVQSFLGFINFYGDFMANSTELTAPLYDLTASRKGTDRVVFTDVHRKNFEELKSRLCAGPRLAHPDLNRPFVVHTDASKFAIGAVLLQRDSSGVERPVSFFSKKLSSPQQNYSTFERECLAVVAALEHFRVYLLGRPFRLRTDHKALSWLFSKEPKASARVSGWLATLMEYPVAIEYVRGTENTIADILSRLSGHAVDDAVPASLAQGVPSFACPVFEVDRLEVRTDWLAEQRADPTIARVLQLLNHKSKPNADDIDVDPALKHYVDVWNQLVVESGLLKHCNERAVSTRVVVLPRLREEVFRSLHCPAHHGYESTLRRIAQRFWWPRVRADVAAFVKDCKVCDRDRPSNPSPRAPLGHLPADQPFSTLYIDIVGGQGSLSLGASPKSILTMIDGLTGWAEAIPIENQRAATVARAIYGEWIARYGVPDRIHSDRGAQFESALFSELCEVFGIEKTRTTPYRPQANGKCERFNRTLVSMLRRAVQKRPYDWEPLLPAVLQAYRSTVSESTGLTPHRLAFGREMRLPVDFGTPLPEPPRDARTFANELSEDLEWSYRVAREVTGFQHRRADTRYNERVVEKLYAPGNLVRVLQRTHLSDVPSKLNAKYSGLCEVLEVRGPVLTLRELDTQRVFTVNHDSVRRSTLSLAGPPPPDAPPVVLPLRSPMEPLLRL